MHGFVLEAVTYEDVDSQESADRPRTTRPDNRAEPEERGQPFPMSRDITQSGCRDLNPGPQRPERCALTKLRYTP